MQPKPTHFVLNIGFWPFSDAFASQMPLVVRALRSVAMHVVWRETSQPSAGNFRPKLTFDAWTSKQHPIQRIDVQQIVQHFLVTPDDPSRREKNRRRDDIISSTTKRGCRSRSTFQPAVEPTASVNTGRAPVPLLFHSTNSRNAAQQTY